MVVPVSTSMTAPSGQISSCGKKMICGMGFLWVKNG
jgi:hypothetical protein